MMGFPHESYLGKKKQKFSLWKVTGPQTPPTIKISEATLGVSCWVRDRNERDRKLVYFTYLWDLEPSYIGVIIQLLTTMDILVGVYPSPLILILQENKYVWWFKLFQLGGGTFHSDLENLSTPNKKWISPNPGVFFRRVHVCMCGFFGWGKVFSMKRVDVLRPWSLT